MQLLSHCVRGTLGPWLIGSKKPTVGEIQAQHADSFHVKSLLEVGLRREREPRVAS